MELNLQTARAMLKYIQVINFAYVNFMIFIFSIRQK